MRREIRAALEQAARETTELENIPAKSQCYMCGRLGETKADIGQTCLSYRDGEYCPGTFVAIEDLKPKKEWLEFV